MNLPKLKTL